MLREWKGRVGSVHLKDVAANAPRDVKEMSMPPTAFTEVGAGTLDWKSILNEARKAGVRHHYHRAGFDAGGFA